MPSLISKFIHRHGRFGEDNILGGTARQMTDEQMVWAIPIYPPQSYLLGGIINGLVRGLQKHKLI